MTIEPIILVDIMQEVVGSMKVPDLSNPGDFLSINYQPGRSYQILKSISDLDNSISQKGLKYPLCAMIMPIREKMGGTFPSSVTIPRISFLHLTKTGTGTETVLSKYESDGIFKAILYPCYYELLKRLAMSSKIIGMDAELFPHEKMDNPCQQSEDSTNDFIDSLDIFNLELILNQTKTC